MVHSHGTAPPPQSAHGTRDQPGPLTLFEHSISLLYPLAGPDLPLSAWRAMFPLSCPSLQKERRSRAEGREESPIVPQPSWAVWTQADSQCQREHPSLTSWRLTNNKNRPAPPTALFPSTTLDPGPLSASKPILSLRATVPMHSTPCGQRHCTHIHLHTLSTPPYGQPLPQHSQRKFMKKGGERQWRGPGRPSQPGWQVAPAAGSAGVP